MRFTGTADFRSALPEPIGARVTRLSYQGGLGPATGAGCQAALETVAAAFYH